MAQLDKLSCFSLDDTLALLCELEHQITDRYLHVKDNINPQILALIIADRDKILKFLKTLDE